MLLKTKNAKASFTRPLLATHLFHYPTPSVWSQDQAEFIFQCEVNFKQKCTFWTFVGLSLTYKLPTNPIFRKVDLTTWMDDFKISGLIGNRWKRSIYHEQAHCLQGWITATFCNTILRNAVKRFRVSEKVLVYKQQGQKVWFSVLKMENTIQTAIGNYQKAGLPDIYLFIWCNAGTKP